MSRLARDAEAKRPRQGMTRMAEARERVTHAAAFSAVLLGSDQAELMARTIVKPQAPAGCPGGREGKQRVEENG